MEIKSVKISVTVPAKDLEHIRREMSNAGAGIVGNYDYCSYSCKVLGTFRPNEKAHPYIGEENVIERVEEEKLEMVCDKEKVKKVITALRKAHPYEEPQIEILPLLDEGMFN